MHNPPNFKKNINIVLEVLKELKVLISSLHELSSLHDSTLH